MTDPNSATPFTDLLTARPLVLHKFAERYPDEPPVLIATVRVYRSTVRDWPLNLQLATLIGTHATLIATRSRLVIRSHFAPFLIQVAAAVLLLWITLTGWHWPPVAVGILAIFLVVYLHRYRPLVLHLPADAVDAIAIPRDWPRLDSVVQFAIQPMTGPMIHVFASQPVDATCLDDFGIVRE